MESCGGAQLGVQVRHRVSSALVPGLRCVVHQGGDVIAHRVPGVPGFERFILTCLVGENILQVLSHLPLSVWAGALVLMLGI